MPPLSEFGLVFLDVETSLLFILCTWWRKHIYLHSGLMVAITKKAQVKSKAKNNKHFDTSTNNFKQPWQLVWHFFWPKEFWRNPRTAGRPEQIEGCQPKALAPPRRHPDLQVWWRWRTSSCGLFGKTRSLSLSKYKYNIYIYNITHIMIIILDIISS